MALIAAASINIDAVIALTITLAVVFFGGIFALMFYGARAIVRRICGNVDIDVSAPRVRTRIRRSPIETDIAKFLRSEYPNRKPAQFI